MSGPGYPRPVVGCVCFVCCGMAPHTPTRETLRPTRVEGRAHHDDVRDFCGRLRGRTLGSVSYEVELVCRCGARYRLDIEHPASLSVSEDFVERVNAAIDPSTPEQRSAAKALDMTANELEAQARTTRERAARLRRGES